MNMSESVARLERARIVLPDAVKDALNAERPLPAIPSLQATAQAYAAATTDKARAAVLADAASQAIAVQSGVARAVEEIYESETLEVVRAHASEIYVAAEVASVLHTEALSAAAPLIPASTDPENRQHTPTPVLVAVDKASAAVAALNGIVSSLTAIYGFDTVEKYPAAYVVLPDEMSAADALRLHMAMRKGVRGNIAAASHYSAVHWFAVAAEVGCTFALLPPDEARKNNGRIGALQSGGIEASAEWE
ncbi:hypothetical protein G5C66_07745 [Nocardioides sp. KC13]|uniref:Uncharacterized protein n=1 Tax=Nocardioides turkmenicus TaxID=2711220 RepID=A0A6M1R1S5_9ACTN|nr:hypothetical protein [Nocardioides sp. KC13]NGN92631.1 hypothetical protein [Nocardioides sp. KC13]